MTTTRTPSRLPRAAGLLLTGVLTLAPLTGAHALVSGVGPSGPCTDPAGVTVVVDLTDLGGEVQTGCATEPTTGTEALQQAGFTDTRDPSGLICAIDSMPDPCPAEFEGVYWSYWFAEPGGQWETAMEGPDTAVPEPGSVQGWRYSDGSAGPTVEPPVLAGAADAAPAAEPTPTGSATDEPVEAAEGAEDAPADAAAEPQPTEEPVAVPAGPDEGGSGPLVGAAALIAALAAGAVLLARHRRSDLANGPAGQS